MKNRLVFRIIAFVLICVLFPTIQLTSVVRVYSAENTLYQSTFDNKDGIIFLSNNWSILSGDLIPKYNDENRLVFVGTNKSDYLRTM